MLENYHHYWQKHIPCLHRLYDAIPIAGPHNIQYQLGLSLSLTHLQERLMMLAKKLQQHNHQMETNKKALITFDDGYRDILLSLPILQQFPDMQPVLFLTGRQLRHDILPLPLIALYDWCSRNKCSPNKMMAQYGFDRQSLKQLPEAKQEALLQKIGVTLNDACDEMLRPTDIETLKHHGWLIGYHGHEHYDLTQCDDVVLKKNFRQDIKILSESYHAPWLAYPEGRYNQQTANIAREAGFTLQFGLEYMAIADDILARNIWQ